MNLHAMTQAEQKVFVYALIRSVEADIIKKIDNDALVEWDGIELRQYIADRFSDVVIKSTMSPKRMREYQNACLVNNL